MTALANFILEKLDTLVVVVNRNGDIDYVSPSVKKVLGYEPLQLTGAAWWKHTRKSDEDANEVKSAMIALLRDNNTQSQTAERKLINANGQDRWILWNLTLGPENNVVAIGHDITERKIKEQILLKSNQLLKHKNKEVLDSIVYSERIQKAILPPLDILNRRFKDGFVLYKPKDIVSGDFYWYFEKNNKVFVAAIDCTGHGVPGALMTVLANSLLKNIIVAQGYEDPAQILTKLDELLFEEINKQEGPKTPDGMDIALCVFDFEKSTLAFSGAFRPLVLIRENEFIEYKSARYPIGFFSDIVKEFETSTIELQPNDTFYMFSDGYVDQFGGPEPNGKKFNKKAFRELLLSMQTMNMEEQEGYLEYSYQNWKQNFDQVDDVLVMGIHI